MKPGRDQRRRGVRVSRPLRNGREPHLALAESCIAVRHAHGAPFVMSVDELDAVLLAQVHGSGILVRIAHDREQVVEPFGRDGSGTASKTFMGSSSTEATRASRVPVVATSPWTSAAAPSSRQNPAFGAPTELIQSSRSSRSLGAMVPASAPPS